VPCLGGLPSYKKKKKKEKKRRTSCIRLFDKKNNIFIFIFIFHLSTTTKGFLLVVEGHEGKVIGKS
jgi:hypothetical protein